MTVSVRDIEQAIRDVGVKAGDLVMVHSRLFSIGLLRDVSEVSDIPQTYLRALQQVLGEAGTVVVPTFTTSFGRHGKPFIYEESPSEMGIFSETVRRAPGSRRTLHPIQSLTALGALAESLAMDHPRWNVGYDTIWDRMLHCNGKVVTIGIPFRQGLSLVHHLEFLACVPYVYHKILRGEVYMGGQRVPGDFFLSARHLRYSVYYNLARRVEPDLESAGAVTRVPLGEEWMQQVAMDAVVDVCMKGFKRDPYYLLEQPPVFVEGEIPCDGVTAQREDPRRSYFRVLR